MQVNVIDSHTEGEPTRVLLEEDFDLGGGSVAEQAEIFARDYDHIRRATMLEPRASEVFVGALLVPATDPKADLGVIFFNNVGVLGMCVHGTMGVVRTLHELDRLSGAAPIALETNVGLIYAEQHTDGSIEVENVASYREHAAVRVELNEACVHADVAWGGNWFALVNDHGLDIEPTNIDALTARSWDIRRVLNDAGHPVDHVELFEPGRNGADSRSFVLCPGGAYDRSPCGTGTSAKVACLAAEQTLAPGETWVQESIIGSRFRASYRLEENHIIPKIRGRGWITGETTLHLEPTDPYRFGIDHRTLKGSEE
jgi:4-hydroxyproline epimerase